MKIFLTLALCIVPAFAADLSPVELGLGINAYNSRDYKGAIQHLRGHQFPALSDYLTYYLASSEQQTGDYDDALLVLAAYRKAPGSACSTAVYSSTSATPALRSRLSTSSKPTTSSCLSQMATSPSR
jgi:hypothetical protein